MHDRARLATTITVAAALTALTHPIPARGAARTIADGSTATYNLWADYPLGQPHPTDPLTINDARTKSDGFVNQPGTSLGLNASGSQTLLDVIAAPDAPGPLPISWVVSGSANATAAASLGTLHASVTASAHLNPTSQTYQYISTSDNTARSITRFNPMVITATADASAGWQDSFTAKSATLAPFSEVQLQATVVFDSAVTTGPGSTIARANFGYIPFGGDFTRLTPELSNDDGANPHVVRTFTFTALTDNPFLLQGSVFLSATGSAQAFIPGPNGTSTSVPDVSLAVNASNTAHFYIDVLTPGVTLTTDSGADYTLPVPEPLTLPLALAALPMLLHRRRYLCPR